MSMDACIKNTAAELGLDERDVREIADRLKAQKKRLAASGTLDRVDEQLRAFAADEAQKARIAAALRRKQAALNIVLRDEWERDIAEMTAAGLPTEEAVLAKLVGSYRGVTKARKSVSARRIALEGQWMGGMLREMMADPDLEPMVKMLRSPRAAKPFMDDVVREMREIAPHGNPGRTGNAPAKRMAELMAKYAEATRIELNKAGANIGKLDGWTPQSHDGLKLLKSKPEEWASFVADKLDFQRSFPNMDAAQVRKTLLETYQTIVTGRDRTVTARQKGQRVGPANLARSLESHRVLHFKDADAWLSYAERYGRGSIVTAMLDHLRMAARKASLMQTLGPNPQVFLDAFLADKTLELRDAGKSDPKAAAEAIGGLSARGTKIGKAMAEIMGETLAPLPGGVTWARIHSGVRSVQSMAKLGGAVISSITDLVTFAHGMRFQGKGLLEGYSDAFKGLLDGRNKAERREISLLLGVGYDTILGDIHARFTAEDSMPGWQSRLQNAFFRLSGLTWWTDRLTDAFARMSSAHMAMKGDWASIDAPYRNVLALHGIDEARWNVVRQATIEGEDGVRYIVPEQVAELPDEAFDGLVGDATGARRDRLIARARNELELDLTAFFSDEASFGVIRADDRTRMFVTQGTRPGTTLGELFRYVMQFKSFPIAYTQKILLPAMRGRGPGETRDIGGLATLIGASFLFGYAAMTAKDVLKNRRPRDPRKLETLLASFVQGGGAGIYGDFLFGKANRFGNSVLETLAGPTIGTGADIVSMWQKAKSGELKMSDPAYLALNNTPFLNLWWARQALDLAVLNDLQEWMSPGTFRRREANMKKEFGQEFLFDPLRPSLSDVGVQ